MMRFKLETHDQSGSRFKLETHDQSGSRFKLETHDQSGSRFKLETHDQSGSCFKLKTLSQSCLAVALSACFVTTHACELQKISENEAMTCGVGATAQEAKADAVRQGIEYLVGSYVTSDLEVNNEAVTKDAVTDYSGAVSERFEIISQGPRGDGMYEISAHIWIKRDADRQRNRSSNTASGNVDSQGLYAQAISTVKQELGVVKLWEDMLTGFPGRAFDVKIGKAAIETIQDDPEHVLFGFPIMYIWRPDFMKEFLGLLEHTGQPVSRAELAKVRHGIDYIQQKNSSNKDFDYKRQSAICLADDNNVKDSEIKCFVIHVPAKQLSNLLCQPEPFVNSVGYSLGKLDIKIHHPDGDIKPERGGANFKSSETSVNPQKMPAAVLMHVRRSVITGVFDFYPLIIPNSEVGNYGPGTVFEKITSLWASKVPVNKLDTLGEIDVKMGGCVR